MRFYQGQWSSNKYNGIGKLYDRDGSLYEGSMKNDLREDTASTMITKRSCPCTRECGSLTAGKAGALNTREFENLSGEWKRGKRWGKAFLQRPRSCLVR